MKTVIIILFIIHSSFLFADSFEEAIQKEKSITLKDTGVISTLSHSYNESNNILDEKIKNTISDLLENYETYKDRDVYTSLLNINNLKNQEEEAIVRNFEKDKDKYQNNKMIDSTTVGIYGVIVYLSRHQLFELYIKALLILDDIEVGTISLFKAHQLISKLFVSFYAFKTVYFYKYELGDGTLYNYYLNNTHEFFKLPRDAQADFITDCKNIDTRKKLCETFEKKIIALDLLLQASIEQNITNDYYDFINDKRKYE